jgi:hypothetical protein
MYSHGFMSQSAGGIGSLNAFRMSNDIGWSRELLPRIRLLSGIQRKPQGQTYMSYELQSEGEQSL